MSIASPTSTPITRFRRRVAPIATVAVLAVACGAGAGSEPSTAPTPSIAINPDGDPQPDLAASPVVAPSASLQVARERCLGAPPYLEAALDGRGEEFDEPELSEEELEQSYAPEFPTVDGVADPEDRPPLEAMGVYDPAAATWEQLDLLIAHCIENDVVSEAELWGEDEDGDEGEDDWCDELASFSEEEVREFAGEEGDDVVRAEFEECGLPNPLDS